MASATPASMLTSTLEAVLKPSWKRLPLCRVRKQCWPNSLAKLRASRAAAELPYLLNEFTEHSLARAARVNKWTATRDSRLCRPRRKTNHQLTCPVEHRLSAHRNFSSPCLWLKIFLHHRQYSTIMTARISLSRAIEDAGPCRAPVRSQATA